MEHSEFPTEQLVCTFGDDKENIWISKLACSNRGGRKASLQLISPLILLGKDHLLLYLQSKAQFRILQMPLHCPPLLLTIVIQISVHKCKMKKKKGNFIFLYANLCLLLSPILWNTRNLILVTQSFVPAPLSPTAISKLCPGILKCSTGRWGRGHPGLLLCLWALLCHVPHLAPLQAVVHFSFLLRRL